MKYKEWMVLWCNRIRIGIGMRIIMAVNNFHVLQSFHPKVVEWIVIHEKKFSVCEAWRSKQSLMDRGRKIS
ncbi:MAG: hypothetical protein ACYSTS_19365 [Planctomycetota bacterium]|jgi:hypothetical protein